MTNNGGSSVADSGTDGTIRREGSRLNGASAQGSAAETASPGDGSLTGRTSAVTSSGSSPRSDAVPVLTLEGLYKSFPGQTALKQFSLGLRPGEIHALVGQNGAGKSTLIKILAGYYHPDPGATGTIGGRPFPFGGVSSIRDAGVRFVHQNLGLIDSLNVADNYYLVSRRGSRWVSSRRAARELAPELGRYGLHVSPVELVGSLTQGQKSLLAIARCLGDLGDAKVLVLDEPTAALPARDAANLLQAIREVAARGVAVLYVSHNLGEILSLAYSVTVLRDAQVVARESAGGLSVESLAHLIAGREVEEIRSDHRTARTAASQSAATRPVLRVRRLSGLAVDDVDLDVYPGEIVGIAGLPNSGRDEFPYLLAGAAPIVGGSLEVDGKPVARLTPRKSLQHGIVLVPADRQRLGGFPALTARENLTAPASRHVRRKLWVTARAQRAETVTWMRDIGVEPQRPERAFGIFSGGNQQKLCLARALRLKPALLVLDEPTQGVDVAAKATIFKRLLSDVRVGGLAVIVASSDPEELATLCDRTIVMKHGRVLTELAGRENTSALILAKMAG